jgi:sec-independent protein translocase protein TatA
MQSRAVRRTPGTGGYTRPMLPNVGAGELVLLFLVALVLFGPQRLPEIGRTIGRGLREFRAAIGGLDIPETPLPARLDLEERPLEPHDEEA